MDCTKKLLDTTTNNKEYRMAQGKYLVGFETAWIDKRPYRDWKLYRKTQYKPIKP